MSTPILLAVKKLVERRAPTLKNRGRLSPRFFYFDQHSTLVTGRDTELSDSATTKFYTVAADMIVFNKPRTHVLMIFRCPHDKHAGRTCSDNVLDTSSFQYKGCLATPGGFFDAAADKDAATGQPDFEKTAARELNEECSSLFERGSALRFGAVRFVGAALNNYRDVRWFTSSNYVPTLAVQFTVDLEDEGMPRVKGSDDACGNAYWVDVRIIEAVFEKHRALFKMFDEDYSQEKFDAFVSKTANHFVFDEKTGLPRNKLQAENGLIKVGGRAGRQDILDFVENGSYAFSDFGFDHVHNILMAKQGN